MSIDERDAYEKWLLNGNRFMTDPYSIFKAGMQAAKVATKKRAVYVLAQGGFGESILGRNAPQGKEVGKCIAELKQVERTMNNSSEAGDTNGTKP